MTNKRLKPDARKEDLLAAALPLAAERGYTRVTRNDIAQRAGVSGPVIHYHFGTMAQFQRELMRYAVLKENLAVVAQGLAAGDKQAKKAPEVIRRRALDSLL